MARGLAPEHTEARQPCGVVREPLVGREKRHERAIDTQVEAVRGLAAMLARQAPERGAERPPLLGREPTGEVVEGRGAPRRLVPKELSLTGARTTLMPTRIPAASSRTMARSAAALASNPRTLRYVALGPS
jgi:hypothetical protein